MSVSRYEPRRDAAASIGGCGAQRRGLGESGRIVPDIVLGAALADTGGVGFVDATMDEVVLAVVVGGLDLEVDHRRDATQRGERERQEDDERPQLSSFTHRL